MLELAPASSLDTAALAELSTAGYGDSALREVLAAARTLGDSLLVLNLPAGHPAGSALRDLGGRVDVRQYEMALTP